MSFFPASLENLIDKFAALPGIGRKSAQRLAFHVLALPEAEALAFADAITAARKSVHCCRVCQNLTEGEVCAICASNRRDHGTICVVSEPRDVLSIERGHEYNGTYHVLHGVLSPMSHVGPEDIRIKELLHRVAEEDVEEVIMATNPDTEGEATAMYISRLLKPFQVKVTRLAYGIPVGSNLEFADDATLNRALEGRTEM
ncbi:MAG: recombination protein RecR [Oscillospiraceae bacterium]|nr:recombination protein RecR [Oscillospiraceae bacterium]